jgi:hypothetical protein
MALASRLGQRLAEKKVDPHRPAAVAAH